jgi:hypothetical protein
MRASAPGTSQQASVKRKWRVSGIWVLYIAFQHLNEVVADVDRSVSDDGGQCRQECFGNYLKGL